MIDNSLAKGKYCLEIQLNVKNIFKKVKSIIVFSRRYKAFFSWKQNEHKIYVNFNKYVA